jgi:transposase
MFANTPKGATASATMYSIVETAKENGLNPRLYLTYVFEQLPNIDITNTAAVDRLLPTSLDLPNDVRMNAKNRSSTQTAGK